MTEAEAAGLCRDTGSRHSHAGPRHVQPGHDMAQGQTQQACGACGEGRRRRACGALDMGCAGGGSRGSWVQASGLAGTRGTTTRQRGSATRPGGPATTLPDPLTTWPHARCHDRPGRACVRRLGVLAGQAGCALGALRMFLTEF